MLERWAEIQKGKGNIAGAAMARTLIEQYGDEPILEGAFSRVPSSELKPISAGAIIDETSNYFGITSEDMVSKRRDNAVVYPRHIGMYVTREVMGMKFNSIGKAFGDRDNSTVFEAVKKISERLSTSETVRSDVGNITNRVRTRYNLPQSKAPLSNSGK